MKSKRYEGEVEEQILRQVEFYFSDDNLATDRFLRSKISENPNGYVDIDVLLKCNRVLELTKDRNVVASSLRKSNVLELLDDKLVRRKYPLRGEDEMRKDVLSRSAVIDSFPEPFPEPRLVDSHLREVYADQLSVVRICRDTSLPGNPFVGRVHVVFKTMKGLVAAVESHYSGRYPLTWYLIEKLRIYPKTKIKGLKMNKNRRPRDDIEVAHTFGEVLEERKKKEELDEIQTFRYERPERRAYGEDEEDLYDDDDAYDYEAYEEDDYEVDDGYKVNHSLLKYLEGIRRQY